MNKKYIILVSLFSLVSFGTIALPAFASINSLKIGADNKMVVKEREMPLIYNVRLHYDDSIHSFPNDGTVSLPSGYEWHTKSDYSDEAILSIPENQDIDLYGKVLVGNDIPVEEEVVENIPTEEIPVEDEIIEDTPIEDGDSQALIPLEPSMESATNEEQILETETFD